MDLIHIRMGVHILNSSALPPTDTGSEYRELLRQHAEKRCIIETALIFLSVLANVIGLALVKATHSHSRSVYHILYISVSVSNILACILTWFVGNLPFFFSGFFSAHLNPASPRHCEAIVYHHMSLPVALCVAIQMNIAMFSLTLCQYYAICKPLQSKYVLQKKRAFGLIGLSVVVFLICACVPFGISMFRVSNWNVCNEEILSFISRNIIMAVNVYCAIIVVLYLVTLSLGLRVFSEIKAFTARTKRMSKRKEVNTCPKKLASDQRAYKATMILLLSRTLFTIPLQIYFVVNVNLYGLHDNVIVTYLTVLPCMKCIFDPLIYGTIMRDVNKTVKNLSARLSTSGSRPPTSSSGKRVSVVSASRNSVFLPSSPGSNVVCYSADPTKTGLYETGSVLKTIANEKDRDLYM